MSPGQKQGDYSSTPSLRPFGGRLLSQIFSGLHPMYVNWELEKGRVVLPRRLNGPRGGEI